MDKKYVLDGRQAGWVKKYQSKFKYVNLRLTKEEHSEIKALADRSGMSMNELIRVILRKAVKEDHI